MIYSLPNRIAQINPSGYVAPSADVIGAVTLGAEASIWFGAVVRADNDEIRIGARANVQDASVLHVDPGAPIDIGEAVTIGHSVMLHGCTIGAGGLVGIGSRVLNHAVIGEQCIVGANTLITERKTFAPRSLILGVPGKVVRELRDEEIETLSEFADHYVQKIAVYRHLKRESD